jgi:hypothetical protein
MNDQDISKEEVLKELLELRRENEALKLASEKGFAAPIDEDLKRSEAKYRLLTENMQKLYGSCMSALLYKGCGVIRRKKSWLNPLTLL